MRIYRNPSDRPSRWIRSRIDLEILEEIVLNDFMTATQLKNRLDTSYKTVAEALSRLVSNRILVEVEIGRLRIYTLNPFSRRAIHIKRFIEEWIELPLEHPLPHG